MTDLVANYQTTLPAEDVVVRAVQFFSGANWAPTSQSPRSATFQGMPPFPWGLMLLTILGFVFCIVPGIIFYYVFVKETRRFQTLAVTVNPTAEGSEVVVKYPPFGASVVAQFGQSLPGTESPVPI